MSIFQDACQLEVLVTPFKEGDLQFLFGISALTQFISREDIDSSAYKGVPKVFKLVNVTGMHALQAFVSFCIKAYIVWEKYQPHTD